MCDKLFIRVFFVCCFEEIIILVDITLVQ